MNTLDTWTSQDLASVDRLNANVRDSQIFLAYAPLTIATRVATQPIPDGSFTKVIFDTEVVDGDGMFSAPSSDLVVRRPGVYSIQWQPHFVTLPDGTLRAGSICINGSEVAQVQGGASGNDCSLNVKAVVPLNTGDVITGQQLQFSGSSLNAGSTTYSAPRIAVRLVSAAKVDVDYTDPGHPVFSDPTPLPSAPPTAPVPTRHTATFQSIWSRSYAGNNSTRWDDSAYCYQGNCNDGHNGNQKSLVGFNYNSIKSTLRGATRISARLTFRVAHTWYNSGSTIRVFRQWNTSKPGTWANAQYFGQLSCVAGRTYNIAVPDWVASSFAAGSSTGIGFAAPSNSLGYYAYMNGATQGGRPYLTFTYYK